MDGGWDVQCNGAHPAQAALADWEENDIATALGARFTDARTSGHCLGIGVIHGLEQDPEYNIEPESSSCIRDRFDQGEEAVS